MIKLYFKSDALSQFRTEVVLGLMEHNFRSRCKNKEDMCILDVRNGKLFGFKGNVQQIVGLVNAEMAYIEALWPNV